LATFSSSFSEPLLTYWTFIVSRVCIHENCIWSCFEKGNYVSTALVKPKINKEVLSKVTWTNTEKH
jgi:hypothetical protein